MCSLPRPEPETPLLRLPVLAALTSFAVYVAAAIPTLYWLDSSELAAAAFTLGISHPPGHPVAALWGKLFTLLPLGGIGFRVALSQAAAGSLAVGALVFLARSIARSFDAPPPIAGAIALLAGALFAFAWSHAIQSVRPEVYALHVALHLCAACLALAAVQVGRARPLGAAAFLVGLGLANHSLLAAVGAIPLAGLALLARPRSAAKIALLLIAGAWGLSIYLYLPLRAAQEPLVNWGHATDLGRFLWVASARTFARAVHRGSAAPVPFEAMVMLGPLTALVAVGGLYLLVRQRKTRGVGLFLLAEIALYGASAGVIAFDPANPDSHGYLSTGLAYLVLASSAFWAMLAALAARAWPRISTALAVLVALLGAGYQLGRNWSRFALPRAYGAERIMQFSLEDLPPNTVLHTRYFQTVFALWYVRGIEGLRPDVDLIHEPFRSFSLNWYEPRLGAPTDGRPIYEEYDVHKPGPDPELLSPGHLFYEAGRVPTLAALRAQDRAWDELGLRLSRDGEDPETRKFLIWTFFLAAQYRCDIGARTEAMAMADRVVALNGLEPPELVELRDRCGEKR